MRLINILFSATFWELSSVAYGTSTLEYHPDIGPNRPLKLLLFSVT